MEAPRVLETARLRLRAPRLEDAEIIFATYAQDPDVTRYLTWLPHRSIEATEKFIESCLNQWASSSAFPYVIIRQTDDQVLGMIDLRPNPHGADIGYVLARKYWRQGIMTEAARCLTCWAMAQPTLFRVQAFCDVENVASARTLEKIGMQREGLLRRYIVHPAVSNEPRDCHLYSIVK